MKKALQIITLMLVVGPAWRATADPLSPWAGIYRDAEMTLELKPQANADFEGVIRFRDQNFPVKAHADGHKLTGAFRSGEGSFDFVATADGDKVSFTTGGKTYQLSKAGASPREGGAPPANPLAAPANPRVPPAQPLADAQGLPQNAVPTGLHVAEGSAGGRIVYGQLSTAKSGDSAFRTGLQCIAEYFPGSLDLQTVKRTPDGTVTVAEFTASLKSQPVKGLALTKVDETQRASIVFLFDSSGRFQQTSAGLCNDFRAIMRQPHEQNEQTQTTTASSRSDLPASAMVPEQISLAGVENVSLTTTECPDGSGSIGIASGFKLQSMALSTFAIKSESDGAYANIRAHTLIFYPKAPVLRTIGRNPGIYVAPYDPDPVNAWKMLLTQTAKMTHTPDPAPQILKSKTMAGLESGQSGVWVQGTMTVDHEPFVFVAGLNTMNMPAHSDWSLMRTVLAAPQRNAAADMPALIAMFKSTHVDLEGLNRACAQKLRGEQADLQTALNRRDQAFQGFQHAVQRHDDVQAKMVAGWNNVIKQKDVVETTINGVPAHATVGYPLEEFLVNNGDFKVVPPSQYVKGVDY